MLYATSHRRTTTLLQRQSSSRESARLSSRQSQREIGKGEAKESRPGSRQSTPSLPPSGRRPGSAQSFASYFDQPSIEEGDPLDHTNATQKRPLRLSFQQINPLNGLRRRATLPWKRGRKPVKNVILPNIAEAKDTSKADKPRKAPTNPGDAILAEKERVREIKKLIDSHDYTEALKELTSDTSEDFFYFNQVKSEVQGEKHDEAFLKRHGKLKDFQERPASVVETNVCLWTGVNHFNQPLRCHNKCLFHPVERVADQLGVEHPKPLNFCAYHVRYCVNTDNHAIPMQIRVPNEKALCNECFVLRNGRKPQELMRIPGTRRKRGG
ncbi:hypothetical protein ACHAWF_018994 [Thalassiosira exigua]